MRANTALSVFRTFLYVLALHPVFNSNSMQSESEDMTTKGERESRANDMVIKNHLEAYVKLAKSPREPAAIPFRAMEIDERIRALTRELEDFPNGARNTILRMFRALRPPGAPAVVMAEERAGGEEVDGGTGDNDEEDAVALAVGIAGVALTPLAPPRSSSPT